MKRLFYPVMLLVVLASCKSSDVEMKREEVSYTTLESLSLGSYERIVTYSPDENGIGKPDFGRPNFIVINDDNTYRKSVKRHFETTPLPESAPLPEINFAEYTLLFAEIESGSRPKMLLEQEYNRLIFTVKTTRVGEYGHHGPKHSSFSAIVPKVEEANVKFEVVVD
jgi:hypothetical protein